MWILGAAALPTLGWAVYVSNALSYIKRETDTLVLMHRSPDDHGFGTGETNKAIMQHNLELAKCIRQNTAAIRSLVHYIQWLSEHTTGEQPPPPIDEEI